MDPPATPPAASVAAAHEAAPSSPASDAPPRTDRSFFGILADYARRAAFAKSCGNSGGCRRRSVRKNRSPSRGCCGRRCACCFPTTTSAPAVARPTPAFAPDFQASAGYRPALGADGAPRYQERAGDFYSSDEDHERRAPVFATAPPRPPRRSELETHDLDPPTIDPAKLRESLDACHSFHTTATSVRYRNCQSSFRVITKLMTTDSAKTLVMKNNQAKHLRELLNIDVLTPVNATSDESLWDRFELHFRAAFELTVEAEEDFLWKSIHKYRPLGGPLYPFAMLLAQLFRKYNKLVPQAAFSEAQQKRMMRRFLRVKLISMQHLNDKLVAIVDDPSQSVANIATAILADSHQVELIKHEVGGRRSHWVSAVEEEESVDYGFSSALAPAAFKTAVGSASAKVR